ncbi:hypothetical protein M892_05605 [Vibrio campbellii ATCC BAA-1116]|uniref:Uncharacterized protein n=1 Tax=Vibrio campbellii (strain ATCC BAA-1116) TaxID=2902295 RepID=A7MV42_VIBC1|nr:hypothetical protein VIBHAR_01500 [Vibrio campbellii ATCC BAA-1116]AGU96398.1 hypothetical protein M892_05605 [Vibrio campbellii ATCC BAA-1116]
MVSFDGYAGAVIHYSEHQIREPYGSSADAKSFCIDTSDIKLVK